MNNKSPYMMLKVQFVIILILFAGVIYLLIENKDLNNEQERIDNLLDKEENIKDEIQMSLTDIHWCGIDHSQGRCFDITIWNKNSDVTIGPNALYILGRTLDLNDTVYYQMKIPIDTIIEPNMKKEYNDRHLIIPGDGEGAEIKTPGCSLEVILFYNGEIIDEWYQDIEPIRWDEN